MNHIDYLREIGARGGAKRRLNPKRKLLASQAALKSWSRSARAKRISNRRAKNGQNAKK